jgi:bifunctional non-homologous end joining protein LigD
VPPVLAPYSPRTIPRAPVAVPLEWDELDDPHLRSAPWTIRTVLDRVATQPDPFRAIARAEQRLPRWE